MNINALYHQAEPADEILPGLWLGSVKAASNIHWLAQKRIKSIFNCTKDIIFQPIAARRYRVPVQDNLEPQEIRNLELWSYEIVYKMIHEYQTGEPMLVHCAAGMQRSAACVAMFLIATRNMRPDQAIEYIQERRPVAFRPSPNFGPAIEGFYTSYQRDIVSSHLSS